MAIIRSRGRRQRLGGLHQSGRRAIRRLPVCGFFQRFRLRTNAKGSPHVSVIPIAYAQSNFELRANCWSPRSTRDPRQARHRAVTDTNVLNARSSSSRRMVLLCAMRSTTCPDAGLGVGIPRSGGAEGVVGKNYCYQTGANANLFFEGRRFNPFISAGGSNHMDDFNINLAFDRRAARLRRRLQFGSGFNSALPIGYRPVPERHAAMGQPRGRRHPAMVPDGR